MPTDRSCLLSACVDHSGDRLNAPPITAVGLRLYDEMIHISVGTRLGARTCEPHICPCGKTVDARGLHGLSWRKSSARHQRQWYLNDIIWRDGQRPDRATLISWARGKALTSDVMVPDTFAQSHVDDTAILAGAAASHAATKKTSPYRHLMIWQTPTFLCQLLLKLEAHVKYKPSSSSKN